MNFPTIDQILDQARWKLNDVGKATYPNEKLIGHLRSSLKELEDALAENGIQVLEETSTNLVVPANTTRIAYLGTVPVLPSDLMDVLSLEEKITGQGNDRFVPVQKYLALPVKLPDSFLGCYAWHEQELKFVGATQPVEIRLRFIKSFPDLNYPVSDTQTIPFNGALPFLAAKTAALVCALVEKDFDRAQIMHDEAQNNLGRLLNRNVRTQQDTPVRRRGWTRHRHRYSRSIDRTRP